MTKSFVPFSKEARDKFNDTGKKIYNLLKNEFPEENALNLDLILNSLCVALTLLTLNYVERDDYPGYLQLVYKILSNNLEKYESCNPRSDIKS